MPLLAALLLCYIGGIVSAFASSVGVLGATIPLAVPFLLQGSSARRGHGRGSRRVGDRGRRLALLHQRRAGRGQCSRSRPRPLFGRSSSTAPSSSCSDRSSPGRSSSSPAGCTRHHGPIARTHKTGVERGEPVGSTIASLRMVEGREVARRVFRGSRPAGKPFSKGCLEKHADIYLVND